MATVNYQIEQLNPESVTATWVGLHNGDVGAAFPVSGYAVKRGEVTGVFGSGGNIRIGVSTSMLHPNYSYDVDYTTTSTFGGLQDGSLYQPSITAGDGTTDLALTIIFVKSAGA